MTHDERNPSPPAEDVPPPSGSRRVWIVLLCVAGVFLVGAFGFGGLVAVFLLTTEEVAVSPSERELLVDAAALAEWMDDFTPQARFERLAKTRYIDQSYDLDYEYDVPDESPYLNYTVSVEATPGDARASYTGMWAAVQVGVKFFGGNDTAVNVEEREDLFSWGDSSRFGLVLANGRPVGNLFVARKDRYVVYLLLVGVYFDETEAMNAFLGPYLERLMAHEPS